MMCKSLNYVNQINLSLRQLKNKKIEKIVSKIFRYKKCNLKIANYLNVKLNLSDSTYRSFRKLMI